MPPTKQPESYYQSTFACLVAETGAPKTNKSCATQQRRAKVTVDATNCRTVKDGLPLFMLKIEYHSTVALLKKKDAAVSPTLSKESQKQPTERKFAFQIGTSKLSWIADENNDQSNNQHSSPSSHHYECSALFSQMKSLNNEDHFVNDDNGTGTSLFPTRNCIVTFERFLEARFFARQMHWLFEVKLPSLSPSLSSSSSTSLSPSTLACALVALPLQWWFEGWAKDSSSTTIATTGISNNNNINDNDDDNNPGGNLHQLNSNRRNKEPKDRHPQLSSNPALVMAGSGIGSWTWGLSDENETDTFSSSSSNSNQQHHSSSLSDHFTSSFYSQSVLKVLPLLEGPRPTKHSDRSSFTWSPCFSSSMLSSAIEGSTVFYHDPEFKEQHHENNNNKSSSQQQQQVQQNPLLSSYHYSSQPVPLHPPPSSSNSLHQTSSGNLSMSMTASFSVADVVAAQQELMDALKEAPAVSSKNIGEMSLVSTVNLDSISKRLFLSEKSGGLNTMELLLSSTNNSSSSNSKGTTTISNKSMMKKCEFRPTSSTFTHSNTSQKSPTFYRPSLIAVPLQEAVVEASSAADNFIELHRNNAKNYEKVKSLFKHFFLGPNSTAISSCARILCTSADSFSGEPTPIVYNATKKCLCLLPRGGTTRESQTQHWASLLIEACFPFCFGAENSTMHHEHLGEILSPLLLHEVIEQGEGGVEIKRRLKRDVLYPVVLLPTRHSPAFPSSASSSSSSMNNNQMMNVDSDSASSSLLYHQQLLSSSSSDASSLHDILLVSALRSSMFGLGSQNSISNFLSSTSMGNRGGNNNSSSSSSSFNLLNILLNKPRPLNYLNVSVVGGIGCGKSTLIKALSRGHHYQKNNQQSSGGGNDNNGFGGGNSSNNSFSNFSSFSGQHVTISEELIFACSFDTFNGYSQATNSVFSCCSASKRTIDEKYQKVQPVLVEAPAQSLPALSGTIASSDIILCVVNCLLPHSLTWIEEKVKPILDEQRSPTLSVDAAALHYARPTVVLVTVNSTSYRRTVTPEDISDLAVKLKNCLVCDLEFGSSGIDSGADHPNRLQCFGTDDAKVICSTIGRTVQCCAAYARLVNSGWLPLHADWLVLSLCFHWEKIFVKRNQALLLESESLSSSAVNAGPSSQQASLTPRANDDFGNDNPPTTHQKQNPRRKAIIGNGKSLFLTVLEDASCVGLNQHISQWMENDLLFSGGCPFSIYDCANHLSMATSAREMRGELVKLLCLKNCVQKNAVSKMLNSIHHKKNKNSNNKSGNSTAKSGGSTSRVAGTTTASTARNSSASGFSTGRSYESDQHDNDEEYDEENDDEDHDEHYQQKQPHNIAAITRTKKIAKKLYLLFSRKATQTEKRQENHLSLESSYAIFQQEAQQIDDHHSSPDSASSSPSAKKRKEHIGLTPSAVMFLLSTFGIIVPSHWLQILWSDVISSFSSASSSSALSSSAAISQQSWLLFLNVIIANLNSSTRQRQQSVFSVKQFTQVDFSFVILHWVLEIAKSSTTEFLSSVRAGWLSRPSEEDDENGENQRQHSSDDEDNLNGGKYPQSPRTPLKKTNSLSPYPTTSSSLSETIKCRSCGIMRNNDQVVRCVVCERKSCIIGDKRCTLFVGGREADQRKQALLSIARTSGGETSDKTLSMMLKQLAHVCQVCLMAHPSVPWQPDSEATTCYCCGSRFSLTKRRHHCRRDGLIVCSSCSKFEGPAFGYASNQRMCIQCYEAPSPFEPLSSSDNHDDHHHQQRAALTTKNNDDDAFSGNHHPFSHRNNNSSDGGGGAEKLYPEDPTSSSDDDEDQTDEDDEDNSSAALLRNGGSDLESATTLSRTFSKGFARDEDPRTVFAPWAHLVLNSEPDSVYRQPWYETIDDEVIGNVLDRIRGMIDDEVSLKEQQKEQMQHHHHHYYSHHTRNLPRAEYVVRQPGYLEEADKKIEDDAVDDDDDGYPSEFDPD